MKGPIPKSLKEGGAKWNGQDCQGFAFMDLKGLGDKPTPPATLCRFLSPRKKLDSQEAL
jgi:hypothetical protein